ALLVFSGGVMLVHDIRKNETRVIDFRETAPSAIHEDMLLNFNLNSGLLVGVPGMLSGMHQAHQLYGRIPWKDVVSMAADVAKNGFNVTHDLGDYRLLSCQALGAANCLFCCSFVQIETKHHFILKQYKAKAHTL
ncbi:Glutathione hydrolase 7, partial [Xenoophorus captivus]